jgi:hypothetical protein
MPARPLRLFISYSHRDEDLCRELETHLGVMKRQGLVAAWHDRMIPAGSEWRKEIDQQLAQADLILLLVSADFIASEYCYEIELEQALIRHRAGTARVVPILVRPAEGWQRLAFGELQALPQEGRPVTGFASHDDAWVHVVGGLRAVIETWQSAVAVASEEVEPPGGGYSERWYIQRANLEKDALIRLGQPAMPAVLRGPQLFGKSLMMQRLLAGLRHRSSEPGQSPIRIVELDLRLFDDGAWTSVDGFFKELARRLMEALGEPLELIEKAWRAPMTPSIRLRTLIAQFLTRQPNEQLVLAFDHADHVCERTPPDSTLPSDFFGLLRGLGDHARSDRQHPLARVRLLVAIASSPAYLLRTDDRSLFYFADDIHLEDLRREEVAELGQRYRVVCGEDDLRALAYRVGGHPYLVRLVLYRCRLEGTAPARLLHDPARNALFDDYLRRIRSRLERAGLYQSVQEVHDNPCAPLGPRTYDYLHRAGILVREEGAFPTRYRLRYPVYERLF